MGWKPNQKTKYKKDEHPELIYTILSAGGTRNKFCAEAGISSATLDNWLVLHKELEDAFEAGLVACQAYWEDYTNQAKTNPEVNMTALRMVLVDRVGFTDKRKLRHAGLLGAKTIEQKQEALAKMASHGLTTGELKDLTASTKDLVEINTLDMLEKKVERLEVQAAGSPHSKTSEPNTTGG